jgi:hypothetical protein
MISKLKDSNNWKGNFNQHHNSPQKNGSNSIL